jgi:hypothetical protein
MSPQPLPPPLVEITLLSLKGVVVTSSDIRIPSVTAAVAFSGSAADMQVGTSFVCPRTGNLMVESRLATTIAREKSGFQPLIAEWSTSSADDDDDDEYENYAYDHDDQPHVSIELPPHDPRLPAMSISRCNRDSKIVATMSSHEQPSLKGSDVSSPDNSFEDDIHGDSVFWSQSTAGAVMPEIVELAVSLKIDTESLKERQQNAKTRLVGGGAAVKETPSLLDASDSWDEIDHAESMFEVGVAYLVLFGNDGSTTVMDLPIKKLKRNFPDSIQVEDTASLRIRVNVFPNGKKKSSHPYRRGYPTSGMSLLQQAYRLHDTNVLEPILRQLKIVEERKKERLEQSTNKLDDHDPNPPILCGVSGVLEMMRSVQCSDGADGVLLTKTDSMDSTINTAPSMTFGKH